MKNSSDVSSCSCRIRKCLWDRGQSWERSLRDLQRLNTCQAWIILSAWIRDSSLQDKLSRASQGRVVVTEVSLLLNMLSVLTVECCSLTSESWTMPSHPKSVCLYCLIINQTWYTMTKTLKKCINVFVLFKIYKLYIYIYNTIYVSFYIANNILF